MTVIKQEHLIQSVADALQFISYYHPVDFIRAMVEAYEKERSPAAKAALQQVLVNSRMCALGKRPICQDTGIVIAFLEIGMDVRWEADMGVEDMIHEGVRRAYLNTDNVLRGSVLTDPDGARVNTQDNSPAVVHTRVVPGDKLRIEVAAKGAAAKPRRSLSCSTPATRWPTGCFPSCQRWVRGGVPQASWVSASAVRRKRPC